jgi:Transposase
MSISAIGRQMGMHRETVRQFICADEYPEARPPIKPSKVSPFTEYLKKRWLEGCYNARQLHREIILLGYEGHLKILQAYLVPWRKLLPEEIRRKQAIPAVSSPTPRAVVWWLLKDKEKLKEEQRAFIGELLEKSPIIKAAYELILEFRRIIKNRDGKTVVEVQAHFTNLPPEPADPPYVPMMSRSSAVHHEGTHPCDVGRLRAPVRARKRLVVRVPSVIKLDG